MQFVIESKVGCFKITEAKMEYKSKNERAKVEIPKAIEFKYKDEDLATLQPKGANDFLTKLGINIVKTYKTKFSDWEKIIQKRLNTLEEKINSLEKEFIKKAKKNTPSGATVEKFVDELNKILKGRTEAIASEASYLYKKMVKDIVETARTKTVSQMGGKNKPSFKKKVVFVAGVIVFIAIIVPIVASAIALPPVGLAIALSIGTGLSATAGFVITCKDFAKNYDKAVLKAAAEVATAVAAVDKAIVNMRLAEDSYTALVLNLGKAMKKMEDPKNKAKSGEDKNVLEAKKKINEAMLAIESFRSNMGDTGIALRNLEQARAGVQKAAQQIPPKSKSGSGSVADILGKINGGIAILKAV